MNEFRELAADELTSTEGGAHTGIRLFGFWFLTIQRNDRFEIWQPAIRFAFIRG